MECVLVVWGLCFFWGGREGGREDGGSLVALELHWLKDGSFGILNSVIWQYSTVLIPSYVQ